MYVAVMEGEAMFCSAFPPLVYVGVGGAVVLWSGSRCPIYLPPYRDCGSVGRSR